MFWAISAAPSAPERDLGVGGADVARIERTPGLLRLRVAGARDEPARVDEIDGDVGAARRLDRPLGLDALLVGDEARRQHHHRLAAAHRGEAVDGPLERLQRRDVAGRGLLVDRGRAHQDVLLDDADLAAAVLRLEALVGGQVGRLAAVDPGVLPAAIDLVGDLLVAEGVDAIRLVVAHLIGRRIGQVEAAQAGDDARQLGPAVGHPRVPAQRRAGRDQRHQVAGLQLAVEELGQRRLGPVAFGLRQVDVVEEQHEGPSRHRADAGVGAVGVAARRASCRRPAAERRDRHRLEQRDGLRAALRRGPRSRWPSGRSPAGRPCRRPRRRR